MTPLRLVLAAVTVTAGLTATAGPAHGHTDQCVGYWALHIYDGLGPIDLSVGATTEFFIDDVGAVCVGGNRLIGLGRVSGQCGIADGQGVTTSSHTFNFRWLGATLYFDGAVSGSLQVIQANTDCLAGRFNVLTVGGTLLLTH